ncbi:MAG: hypothetical protein ABGZ19_06990 [Verrucomicrobiales bacterium]
MITLNETLDTIRTERNSRMKFPITDAMLTSAYDKIKWMISVLPAPTSDEAVVYNTEQLALIWIKENV